MWKKIVQRPLLDEETALEIKMHAQSLCNMFHTPYSQDIISGFDWPPHDHRTSVPEKLVLLYARLFDDSLTKPGSGCAANDFIGLFLYAAFVGCIIYAIACSKHSKFLFAIFFAVFWF